MKMAARGADVGSDVRKSATHADNRHEFRGIHAAPDGAADRVHAGEGLAHERFIHDGGELAVIRIRDPRNRDRFARAH